MLHTLVNGTQRYSDKENISRILLELSRTKLLSLRENSIYTDISIATYPKNSDDPINQMPMEEFLKGDAEELKQLCHYSMKSNHKVPSNSIEAYFPFAYIDFSKIEEKIKSEEGFYFSLNNIEFNLFNIAVPNIPNFIRKLKRTEIQKIKNVYIISKELAEESILEQAAKHAPLAAKKYDGIIKSAQATSIDFLSLLKDGPAYTHYNEILLSTGYIQDDSLYIPLSGISFVSLVSLLFVIHSIVKSIDYITSLKGSWFFSKDENSFEKTEDLIRIKEDYLSALMLMERRRTLINEKLELIESKIDHLNKEVPFYFKLENNYVSMIYSTSPNSITIKTRPIIVKDTQIPNAEYALGSIEVILMKNRDIPVFHNLTTDVYGSPIPHSSGTSVCLGNISDEVANCLSERKEFDFLIDYVINFLRKPVFHDPWGKKVRLFPLVNPNNVSIIDLITINKLRMQLIKDNKRKEIIIKSFRFMSNSILNEKNRDELDSILSEFSTNSFIDRLNGYLFEDGISLKEDKTSLNLALLIIREEALLASISYLKELTPVQKMKILNIKENEYDIYSLRSIEES